MITQTLVIGVGNTYRGDDAAGLMVARQLKARGNIGLVFCEQTGEGVALMQAWQGMDQVIVIDAVASDAAPGTIYRFEANAQPIPSRFYSCSTHAFGVAEAIELARALHELPAHLVAYGIEGENFGAGIGLTGPVLQAVNHVVESILSEVRVYDARIVHHG
jgi:hydrogenase maturation protease